MPWKETLPDKGIGWGFLSDPVIPVARLCISSLFLMQMAFITTETHCLSQETLIYSTSQDTVWPNRGSASLKHNERDTMEAQGANFKTYFDLILSWKRRKVRKRNENMPKGYMESFQRAEVGRREKILRGISQILPALHTEETCPLPGSWRLTYTAKGSGKNSSHFHQSSSDCWQKPKMERWERLALAARFCIPCCCMCINVFIANF